ncbi:hypothetical protein [Geomonas agri]|uniref:hypothetical protein n=1 Tax=Geomonas agri TaxID=2873702 RepID=UPI001CD7C84D|nr:hypothetical protein [Geomonas agri]
MTLKDEEVYRRKKELLARALHKADEADLLDRSATKAKTASWESSMRDGMGLATNQSAWEPIVEVGAEGGSITLYGHPDVKGQWWFCLDWDERTLAMFLDEINHDLLSDRSGVVTGWEEGLKLLYQYPWCHLHPCFVHHEFRKLVLAEIVARQSELDDYEVQAWQRICSDSSNNTTSNNTKDDQVFRLVEEKPRRKMATLVKEYLKKKRPLTVVKLTDVYTLAHNKKEQDSIRAALHRVSVGTAVFKNSTPSTSYAVRLCLLNNEEVFLSLPGVPTRELRTEKAEKQYTKEIFKRFAEKYGAETIKYWVQSAQHRSVVQAACGMRHAKKRDGRNCILCEVEGIADGRDVFACHVVSRKVLFWEAIEEVENIKKTIFTDEAVLLLRKKLKNSPRHSDSEYIVTLCREHDNLLANTISESIGKSQ